MKDFNVHNGNWRENQFQVIKNSKESNVYSYKQLNYYVIWGDTERFLDGPTLQNMTKYQNF